MTKQDSLARQKSNKRFFLIRDLVPFVSRWIDQRENVFNVNQGCTVTNYARNICFILQCMQVWSNSAGVYPSRQKKWSELRQRLWIFFSRAKEKYKYLPGWWCIAKGPKEYETNVLIFSNTNSLIKILLWLWPYDKLSTETVKLTTKLKKIIQMNFKLPRAVQLKLQVTAVPLGRGNETTDLLYIELM